MDEPVTVDLSAPVAPVTPVCPTPRHTPSVIPRNGRATINDHIGSLNDINESLGGNDASFPSPSPPPSPFPLRPLQPLIILHKPTHHLPRFPQPRQYACLKRVSIAVHRDQLVIVHFPIAQVGHFAGVVGRESVQEGHHGRVIYVVHRAKNGCVWVLGREFQECTDVLVAGV